MVIALFDTIRRHPQLKRECVGEPLAHTVSNKVEAAYRQGDLFEKRRRLKIRAFVRSGTIASGTLDVAHPREAAGSPLWVNSGSTFTFPTMSA